MNEQETKRCPYCGEEILLVAKKCRHCGEWLEQMPKKQIPCPICAELIDEDAAVCPHCNERIQVEYQTMQQPTSASTVPHFSNSSSISSFINNLTIPLSYLKICVYVIALLAILSIAIGSESVNGSGGINICLHIASSVFWVLLAIFTVNTNKVAVVSLTAIAAALAIVFWVVCYSGITYAMISMNKNINHELEILGTNLGFGIITSIVSSCALFVVYNNCKQQFKSIVLGFMLVEIIGLIKIICLSAQQTSSDSTYFVQFLSSLSIEWLIISYIIIFFIKQHHTPGMGTAPKAKTVVTYLIVVPLALLVIGLIIASIQEKKLTEMVFSGNNIEINNSEQTTDDTDSEVLEEPDVEEVEEIVEEIEEDADYAPDYDPDPYNYDDDNSYDY